MIVVPYLDSQAALDGGGGCLPLNSGPYHHPVLSRWNGGRGDVCADALGAAGAFNASKPPHTADPDFELNDGGCRHGACEAHNRGVWGHGGGGSNSAGSWDLIRG